MSRRVHSCCDECDRATVHVITDLGPTDGPGLIVRAHLLGPHVNGMRIFYYDPFLGRNT